MGSNYKITAVINGTWKQNCYLLSNEAGQLIIIDPGSNAKDIICEIDKLNGVPIAILNTHAHYDHIGAVSDLIQKYKIPFYLNKKDEKLLKQANLYKILFESKESVVIPSFDRDFGQESAKFSIGNFFIEIVSTPGHTPGSVCIQVGKNIFVGDTLLSSGPGSTHLPGGNQFEMDESINKLQKLPEDLCVYPGHGRPFTLNFFWNKYFAPKS